MKNKFKAKKYNDPDGCAEEAVSTLLKLMKNKAWSMGWKYE